MPEPKSPRPARSRSHWFVQGFCIAFLLIAAGNAASFFWRSAGIDSLFEGNVRSKEAIGFPIEIWNANSEFGPLYINYLMMAVNGLFGAILGLFLGGLAMKFSAPLDGLIRDFENQAASQNRSLSLQFSMFGLMGATAILGLLVAGVTQWAGTRELLWFVYLLGPTLLIGIAFLPQGLHWQTRCLILTSVAGVVIAGAIWSGNLRGMEFDRVMMGIFVFWTPQSAIAAFLLLVGIIVQRLKSERSVVPTCAEK
ncbi:hypothetical protein OAG68_01535 [bacterium]|nr:hypothetical protein [bacterium]